MTKIYDDSEIGVSAPWWKALEVTDVSNSYMESQTERLVQAIDTVLVRIALSTQKRRHRLAIGGSVTLNANFSTDVLDFLKELDAKCIFGTYNTNAACFEQVYVWPNGFLHVFRYGALSLDGKKTSLLETGEIKTDASNDDVFDGEVDSEEHAVYRFNIDSFNELDVKEFAEIFHANTVDPPPPSHEHPGYIYMLALTMSGVRLIPVGLSGAPLVRENYTDKVCADFDKSVKDLNSKNPRGRLIVLEGPPGTGKTNMVKAFMNACPEARFVFIQPAMLEKLSDPSIIPTFIGEMDGPGPIVLVIEDADACLAERKAQNMGSISAMLNLSDGIVGSLFDLRIMATTNTRVTEFEQALLRPGRLSAHLILENLPHDQAKERFKALAGDPNAAYPFNEAEPGPTLADVYSKARVIVDSLVEKEETDDLLKSGVLN